MSNKSELTKAQKFMLAEACSLDGLFEIATIGEISTAKALMRKGLGAYDDKTWNFVANDAGKAANAEALT